MIQIIIGGLMDLYLQNRMNYELRAVWFDYSGGIFGAEHMRQVSPLGTRKWHRQELNCTVLYWLGNINVRQKHNHDAYRFQRWDGGKVRSSSIALRGGDDKN